MTPHEIAEAVLTAVVAHADARAACAEAAFYAHDTRLTEDKRGEYDGIAERAGQTAAEKWFELERHVGALVLLATGSTR